MFIYGEQKLVCFHVAWLGKNITIRFKQSLQWPPEACYHGWIQQRPCRVNGEYFQVSYAEFPFEVRSMTKEEIAVVMEEFESVKDKIIAAKKQILKERKNEILGRLSQCTWF